MAEESLERIAEERIEEAARTEAVKLSLSQLRLTRLPESIGQLTQLQELDLISNQLTALPESIGRLTNLRKLLLHSNRLSQDYRFGHPGTDSIGEPRLRCNVFALLSRSILLSSPVRLQIGSGQGVPATPAATLPTPLRPCLSATPRSGCPALAALPSGHRQRPDPAQHVTEQPPVQMSLGQQQPVVAGMFDQTAAGLH